jgi:hypothetical protein
VKRTKRILSYVTSVEVIGIFVRFQSQILCILNAEESKQVCAFRSKCNCAGNVLSSGLCF